MGSQYQVEQNPDVSRTEKMISSILVLTLAVVASAAGDPFKCSGPGDVVGVKGDAYSYFICTSATSHETGHKNTCSPRLIFDLNSKGCDYPDRVKRDDCKGQRLKCSAPVDTVGVMGDCSAYVMCNTSGEVKLKCSPGFIFDLERKGCDYPQLVKRVDCD